MSRSLGSWVVGVFLAALYVLSLPCFGNSEPDLPPIDLTGSPWTGNKSAPVTIVEFTDFECPFCASVQPTLKQLLEQYPDQIRLVFKNYPLGFHRNARKAHLAAMCAEEQGKFWPYRYHLFGNQRALKKEDLLRYAESFGLGMEPFERCLEEEKYSGLLQKDYEQGLLLGVRGTPTFFVNGTYFSGAQPLSFFKSVIEAELNRAAPKSSG